MRRATEHRPGTGGVTLISIHALHEESDFQRMLFAVGVRFQSTLSMRRATFEFRQAWWWPRFQSTLSMRRATSLVSKQVRHGFISIHALHEESDSIPWPCSLLGLISIHALHEESDGLSGRETDTMPISIHALHEESDLERLLLASTHIHFNPRSP